jgi:flagellar assembly protein FliH
MNKSVKFTFDTDFDERDSDVSGGDARARKSFSTEEIEMLRREAREEGRKHADILASQAVAASIGQVAAATLAAIEAIDGEVERLRAEAASLALAAARKLAGAALDRAPEAEIAEALNVALHHAIGEARVVVKTPPALAKAIEGRAAEIAAEQGFEGRIQVAGDNSLSGADCRIEWRGGGVERAHSVIEGALADLIARRFGRIEDQRSKE